MIIGIFSHIDKPGTRITCQGINLVLLSQKHKLQSILKRRHRSTHMFQIRIHFGLKIHGTGRFKQVIERLKRFSEISISPMVRRVLDPGAFRYPDRAPGFPIVTLKLRLLSYLLKSYF
jgi:hypothetical protein